MTVDNRELAKMIVDALSDGYDDEENREEEEAALYNEMFLLGKEGHLMAALQRLCERVEELGESESYEHKKTGRINSEIFTYSHINNYVCFDEVMRDLNGYIKEKGVFKEDIIEYRTENTYDKQNHMWTLTVILSWWGER